ncbi:MAG: hypothetical protein NTY30_00275 [Candidatus Berkelbacteria bacterium]|nr:hypothetical protein [Candidatus Berkelbacteria bacterium]
MPIADKAYQTGVNDLVGMLAIVSGRRFRYFGRPRPRGRILIRDINPPKFWELPEIAAIIQWSGVPTESIIFIPSFTDDLRGDHPIVRLVDSGLAVIHRPISAMLPIGFRVADIGRRSAATLMEPNEDDPDHPWIRQHLDRMSIAYILSQIDNALAQGIMV